MNRARVSIPLTAAVALSLSGCELVQGIFKVGFWAGAIMIAFVLALVFFLVRFVR